MKRTNKSPKSTTCVTLDYEIIIWLRQQDNFNLSEFLNDMLKKTYNIKGTKIPQEKSKLENELMETRIKLQLLEMEAKKIKEAEEEEASHIHIIQPRGETEW